MDAGRQGADFDAVFIALMDKLRLLQRDFRLIRQDDAIALLPYGSHGSFHLCVFLFHPGQLPDQGNQLIFSQDLASGQLA